VRRERPRGSHTAKQRYERAAVADGTSLGFVPAFKERGLGYIDPKLAEVTRQSVETYMGIKNIPPVDQLYTNQFVGSVRLTPAEWATVEQRIPKELPSMRG